VDGVVDDVTIGVAKKGVVCKTTVPVVLRPLGARYGNVQELVAVRIAAA
jgi:hypothetical protein